MYAICTYIYHKNTPQVGKYTVRPMVDMDAEKPYQTTQLSNPTVYLLGLQEYLHRWGCLKKSLAVGPKSRNTANFV